MRKMIVGVSGQAGSGKDTVADYLVKNHGFVKVALADPLKQMCKSIYRFTDEQLWGPSEMRNKPDKRYPRNHSFTEKGVCACCGYDSIMGTGQSSQCYLTARYALQLLGTEWGRHCYCNTWVDYTIRIASTLLQNSEFVFYSQQLGLIESDSASETYLGKTTCNGVVISDVRFQNEIDAVKAVGGFVARVSRLGSGLKGAAALHKSESEMRDIDNKNFDYVIDNQGTFQDLENIVRDMVNEFEYNL